MSEWYEKESAYYRTYENGRQARNLWKYIPAQISDAIAETSVDIDGYWIYLENGFTAYDGAEDCNIIHEYNVADLKKAIKSIRRVK